MVVVLESDNRAVGEASGVQTRAVRVAVNPKEVISPGIGAPYLRRCPDDLIFFFPKNAVNGTATHPETGKE